MSAAATFVTLSVPMTCIGSINCEANAGIIFVVVDCGAFYQRAQFSFDHNLDPARSRYDVIGAGLLCNREVPTVYAAVRTAHHREPYSGVRSAGNFLYFRLCWVCERNQLLPPSELVEIPR